MDIIKKLCGLNSVVRLPFFQQALFTLLIDASLIPDSAKEQSRALMSWFRTLQSYGNQVSEYDAEYDFWDDLMSPIQDKMQTVLAPEEFRLWEDLTICTMNSKAERDEMFDEVHRLISRGCRLKQLRSGIYPKVGPPKGRLP